MEEVTHKPFHVINAMDHKTAEMRLSIHHLPTRFFTLTLHSCAQNMHQNLFFTKSFPGHQLTPHEAVSYCLGHFKNFPLID